MNLVVSSKTKIESCLVDLGDGVTDYLFKPHNNDYEFSFVANQELEAFVNKKLTQGFHCVIFRNERVVYRSFVNHNIELK